MIRICENNGSVQEEKENVETYETSPSSIYNYLKCYHISRVRNNIC
jgi:hypothetical protein